MCKAKILANLQSHGYKHVNYTCAMKGLLDQEVAGDLESLICEGKVERKVVDLGYDKFDRPIQAPLYRIAPNYEMVLPENRRLHLTIVK